MLVSKLNDLNIGPKLPTDEEVRLAREAVLKLFPKLADPNVRPMEMTLRHQDGEEKVQIPLLAARLVKDVLSQLARGNAVTVMPIHAELSTHQAADLLDVSRPYLIKLLDKGKIPHHKVGSHRRIRLADVLEYKREKTAKRLKALEELAAQAQELDMGY